jgi:hypothetical protein
MLTNMSPELHNRDKIDEDGFMSMRMMSGRMNNVTVQPPEMLTLNVNNNEHSVGSILSPASPTMTGNSSKTTQFLDFRMKR